MNRSHLIDAVFTLISQIAELGLVMRFLHSRYPLWERYAQGEGEGKFSLSLLTGV